MQALCFYVLASFKRDSSFSTEAGLKYFISGSFISGLFLFGASLIYGGLGTLNFNNISLFFSFTLINGFTPLNFLVIFGLLLITITFLFKIAAAPFHFWSPDVYEGSPLSSTIVFSVLPKIVLFNFLIKWICVLSVIFYDVKVVLYFIGIFSVFFGTFFAIKQTRVKRLIIYSSIAQIGFLVSALSTNTLNGFSSVYFFLVIYTITSVLVWTHIVFFCCLKKNTKKFEKNISPLFLSNLSNFFRTNRLWAFSLLIIFFSIAGIPPLSGFLSKIFILLGLVESKELLVSLFLILISAVSVFYYIRIIKIVFFESKNFIRSNNSFQTVFHTEAIEDYSIVSFCLFLLIFLFFYPNFLLLLSQNIVLGSYWF
jgi:NADH-quinone oxidoreductase subunit N